MLASGYMWLADRYEGAEIDLAASLETGCAVNPAGLGWSKEFSVLGLPCLSFMAELSSAHCLHQAGSASV